MKATSIGMQDDINALLARCESDPANRRRYVSLILDLDPYNQEVLKFSY